MAFRARPLWDRLVKLATRWGADGTPTFQIGQTAWSKLKQQEGLVSLGASSWVAYPFRRAVPRHGYGDIFLGGLPQ